VCDRLAAARAAREAVRDRLTAASLARLNAPDPETFEADARFSLNALPALTTRPDQIKRLRQSILNLAVRGKLVPQHPNDEPASELLKRIAKEKRHSRQWDRFDQAKRRTPCFARNVEMGRARPTHCIGTAKRHLPEA
jgi:type I restriction enzyme S subunit